MKLLEAQVRPEERDDLWKSAKLIQNHSNHAVFLLTELVGKEIGVTDRFGKSFLVMAGRTFWPCHVSCFPCHKDTDSMLTKSPGDPQQAESPAPRREAHDSKCLNSQRLD